MFELVGVVDQVRKLRLGKLAKNGIVTLQNREGALCTLSWIWRVFLSVAYELTNF